MIRNIPLWQRVLFVCMDFSQGYPALNSMWTLWLFLRKWSHFHNFYFLHLCLGFVLTVGVLWDPRLFLQWYLNTKTVFFDWEAKGGIGGNVDNFKVFFFFTGICWYNPFLPIQEIETGGDSFEDKINAGWKSQPLQSWHAYRGVMHANMTISWWKE